MQRAGVNIDLCAEIEEVSLQCTAPEVTLWNQYDETDGHLQLATPVKPSFLTAVTMQISTRLCQNSAMLYL